MLLSPAILCQGGLEGNDTPLNEIDCALNWNTIALKCRKRPKLALSSQSYGDVITAEIAEGHLKTLRTPCFDSVIARFQRLPFWTVLINMNKTLVLVGFYTALGVASARADFIVSGNNLGNYIPGANDPTLSNTAVGVSNSGYKGIAQQFTVPSGIDLFNVSTLTLPALGNFSDISFAIKSNPSDSTALYTGNFSGGFQSSGAFTDKSAPVTAVGDFHGLTGGSSYWLVVTADPAQSGPPLAWQTLQTPSDLSQSFGGSTWSALPNTFAMSLADGELTPAPEPGQIAMGAVLCSCIAGYTYRQRKANQKKA